MMSAVTGDMMKKNLSAPSGIVSSLNSSLIMSANIWRIPPAGLA